MKNKFDRYREITSTLVNAQATMITVIVTVITVASAIKPEATNIIKVDILINSLVFTVGIFAGLFNLYKDNLLAFSVCVLAFIGGMFLLLKILSSVLFAL
jgi:hypothetical protein